MGVVKKMLAAKADVNKQGKQDMSALHLAARKRQVKVVEVLLAAGADANQQSVCGTPLQLARKNGGADLLKLFGVEPETPPTCGDSKAVSASSLSPAQMASL